MVLLSVVFCLLLLLCYDVNAQVAIRCLGVDIAIVGVGVEVLMLVQPTKEEGLEEEKSRQDEVIVVEVKVGPFVKVEDLPTDVFYCRTLSIAVSDHGWSSLSITY